MRDFVGEDEIFCVVGISKSTLLVSSIPKAMHSRTWIP